jgi:hypothetical protein
VGPFGQYGTRQIFETGFYRDERAALKSPGADQGRQNPRVRAPPTTEARRREILQKGLADAKVNRFAVLMLCFDSMDCFGKRMIVGKWSDALKLRKLFLQSTQKFDKCRGQRRSVILLGTDW